LRQAKQALGGRLREIRAAAGLTQRDLAALAGWHSSDTTRAPGGAVQGRAGSGRAAGNAGDVIFWDWTLDAHRHTDTRSLYCPDGGLAEPQPGTEEAVEENVE